jgi:nitroimidazol reductase NimA-like FMN-containing flavoprotein (pyridoxamine 5'-phosphate oxidase superfamily)
MAMAELDRPPWIEYLSPAECWKLLSLHPVGRVGVIVDSAPEIYPVNHVVDRQSVVFRTDAGNKLRGLERSPAVCFEADGINLDDCTGWSVLVKGRAVDVTSPDELTRVGTLPLHSWASDARPYWVRIIPREITGRRIHRDHD